MFWQIDLLKLQRKLRRVVFYFRKVHCSLFVPNFFLIYQALCAEEKNKKERERRLLMESSLLLWMQSRLLWCILATALSARFKNTSRRFVPAEGFWSRAVQMIPTSNGFQTVVRGRFHAFLPINPAFHFDAFKFLTMSPLIQRESCAITTL